jgi:hypothetical protein
MRRAGSGLIVGLAVYFALIALAAVAVTAGTATLDSRATAWEVVSGIVGLVAGFASDRTARGAARPVRYGVALAGPALIALAFALTTSARDTAGLWVAFAATLAGAALGAALREALGRR